MNRTIRYQHVLITPTGRRIKALVDSAGIILHPTFNVSFGATASEGKMSIDSIWIHAESLVCYNDRVVLDIPLQLVGKDESGKVVLTQVLDLHKQTTNENICENTGSAERHLFHGLFIDYPNAKTALKPDHTYTFEINSPQAGNEDLVFPIGTFEYRDGNFIHRKHQLIEPS
jgi:hypothetical protein